MLEKFDLLLFDLDGTLIDTAAEIAGAVNDTLADFELPPIPDAEVKDWIGLGAHETLRRALARAAALQGQGETMPDGIYDQALGPYDRHYAVRCGTDSAPYPDTMAALARLRHLGKRLAVVTNKPVEAAEASLSAHGLRPFFDLVIGGDSLPTCKPDPAGVEHCLNHFAVPPARALFIGDSSIDTAAARNAGIEVWLLPHGYNMGQPLTSCAPDRILTGFADFLAA